MSASARARPSQKYKSRLSLERGGYGPHTGTPMSRAERARRFRERRKADAVTQSRRIDTMASNRQHNKTKDGLPLDTQFEDKTNTSIPEYLGPFISSGKRKLQTYDFREWGLLIGGKISFDRFGG
ncbi:hypothetical protein TNCV_4347451 [Trichonephila clavipes]|nr:hypothetical protein TNCV_4347451 [Trichonephila clavipes]